MRPPHWREPAPRVAGRRRRHVPDMAEQAWAKPRIQEERRPDVLAADEVGGIPAQREDARVEQPALRPAAHNLPGREDQSHCEQRQHGQRIPQREAARVAEEKPEERLAGERQQERAAEKAVGSQLWALSSWLVARGSWLVLCFAPLFSQRSIARTVAIPPSPIMEICSYLVASRS